MISFKYIECLELKLFNNISISLIIKLNEILLKKFFILSKVFSSFESFSLISFFFIKNLIIPSSLYISLSSFFSSSVNSFLSSFPPPPKKKLKALANWLPFLFSSNWDSTFSFVIFNKFISSGKIMQSKSLKFSLTSKSLFNSFIYFLAYLFWDEFIKSKISNFSCDLYFCNLIIFLIAQNHNDL